MACGSSTKTPVVDNTDYAKKYAETITAKDLGAHLFTYASDEFEGRNTGEPGQKKAVAYLKDFYVANGIESAYGNDDYFQEISEEWFYFRWLNIKGINAAFPIPITSRSRNLHR